VQVSASPETSGTSRQAVALDACPQLAPYVAWELMTPVPFCQYGIARYWLDPAGSLDELADAPECDRALWLPIPPAVMSNPRSGLNLRIAVQPPSTRYRLVRTTSLVARWPVP
jgi:hypothetical protein